MQKLLTDEMFETIIPRMLSEGWQSKDIAVVLGVTHSTLKVKCSERKLSLRSRPPPPPIIKERPVHNPPTHTVDYRIRTTMPIRDTHRDGQIFCLVDIYGWTGRDVCVIPGGSDPLIKAVMRMGLDPDRYQAMIWDAQVKKESR